MPENVEKEKMNMKEMFKGYSTYSEEEYKRIWQDGMIVVDTNILLNFYRYSEDTKKSLFDILKKQKKRLWIPYQVGKEFFNNKNNVMFNSYNEYDSLIGDIEKKITAAKNEVNAKKNNQLKCKSNIIKLLEECQEKIEHNLTKEKNSKTPNLKKDDIEEKILDLFNNSIGTEIIGEEYEEIKKEGLRRFKEGVPPGYKDDGKPENGDYYIFYSFVQKAKEEKKDVIFVTDDVKEDWFCKISGKNLGGRNELLNEFYKKTGKLLLVYTSDGFAEEYNKNLEQGSANKDIIDELKMIRDIRSKEYDNVVLDRLKFYRENIEEAREPAEVFIALRHAIARINAPRIVKDKFYHRLMSIRNYTYHNEEFDSEQVKDFIDEILNYQNYNINYNFKIRMTNVNEDDFTNKCNYFLRELKFCRSKTERVNIYRQMLDFINEQVSEWKDNPRKYNYELIEDAQIIISLIYQAIDEDNIKNRRDLIDMLERVSNKKAILVD